MNGNYAHASMMISPLPAAVAPKSVAVIA